MKIKVLTDAVRLYANYFNYGELTKLFAESSQVIRFKLNENNIVKIRSWSWKKFYILDSF